jgi:O-antigen/teichoic acid export membrane protein
MEQEPLGAEPASLVSNSTWMLLARVFGLVVGGLLSIVAARTFSLESFGYYSIALALVGIFGILSEAGLGFVAMRRFIEEPQRQSAVLALALSAELLTGLLAVAAMVPLALLLGYPSAVIVPVAVGGFVVLAQGFISPIDALFHARRIVSYAAIAVAVGWAVAAAVGFAALAAGGGPAWLVAAMATGYSAAAVVGAILVPAKTGARVALARDLRAAVRFIRASIPIAAAGAVGVIYQRVDTLIVSKLESAAAAALYSVPFTLVQFFLVIPSIIGGAFFPVLSAELESDRESAVRSLVLLNRIFLLTSATVAIGLTFAAGDALSLLFGHRYDDSATTLAILAWTIPCLFVQQLYWYALLARYRERTALLISTVFLAVNVALNLVLVSAYGIEGAAVALLLTDVGITAVQGLALHRSEMPLPAARLLSKPLLAMIPAIAAGLLLDSVSGTLAGLSAAAIFAAVLLVLGYVDRDEWEPLLEPLRAATARLRPSR